MRSHAYDSTPDEELVALSKQVLLEWDRLPPESILERAEKSGAYDEMVKELQRRMANRLAAELGFPEEP